MRWHSRSEGSNWANDHPRARKGTSEAADDRIPGRAVPARAWNPGSTSLGRSDTAPKVPPASI